MEKRAVKMRSGLTLIEIMVAILVIVVGVLGAMMYRYHSALDARRADIKAGAGRVGLLMLEGWKGSRDVWPFDPTGVDGLGDEVLNATDIVVTELDPGYQVRLLGGTCAYYFVVFDMNEMAEPNEPDMTKMVIRELKVTVTWNQGAVAGVPSGPGLDMRTVTLKDYVHIFKGSI